MSLDVSLEVDLPGGATAIVHLWNYTTNCAPMWLAAGFDLGACDGRDAAGCAEGLGAALALLEAVPGKFRAMNPANGWGDYDGLLVALKELLQAMEAVPHATVRVAR